MNIREACTLALSCGLKTMGEALQNVQSYICMFWPYEKTDTILTPIEHEFSQYEFDTRILDIFPDLEDIVKNDVVKKNREELK